MATPAPPWEGLSRRQQQVLTRLLARVIAGTPRATEVQAPEVQGWFGVSGNTAREWLNEWAASGFLAPVRGLEALRAGGDIADRPGGKALLEQAKRESPDSTSTQEG